MDMAIENTSSTHQLLRFASGRTWRLAPGETLEPVESVEIKGSRWLRRLEKKRLINIREAIRSKEMTADEAIEHIQNTPPEDLRDFLSPQEDRKTVLQAMKDKKTR